MSEDNVRRLTRRHFLFAILMLIALVSVRGFDLVDGMQFMTGFLALGAGYFTADYASQEKGGS